MKVAELCRVVSILSVSAVVACGDGDSVKKQVGDAGTDAAAPDSGGNIVPPECPSISFVEPAAGASLNEANDKDQDSCVNGFQYDVSVATSAADGTSATLFSGSSKLADTTVMGAVAKFAGVQLTANGQSLLSVQVGGSKCVAERQVSVSCNVPACDITKPVLSASHPRLNGIPVANGGDRASSSGSPYQVAVEVSTSVEDGQPVQLIVDGSEVLLTALAKSGRASFPGVTLAPDGTHEIVAKCTAASRAVGTSAKASYPVDSESPQLTVASPADGAHFEQVATFAVCATTTSADAWDLPSESGPTGQNNLCAAIGGAAPSCGSIVSEAAGASRIGKACVNVPCPGGPAFDVTLTLRDGAGNASTKVVSGLTCRTDLPGVEIVSPSSTVAGDPTTRILAASSTQTRKDADGVAAGAQFTVRACTDVQGAPVQLTAGLAGGGLTAIGAPVNAVASVPADSCPEGKSYVARFTNATLPESLESASGTLTTATRLVATVNDSGTQGASLPVDLWIDSSAPLLSAVEPSPLCGYFRQSAVDWTSTLRVNSSVLPLEVTVRHPDGSTVMRRGETYGMVPVVTLGTVTFAVGDNLVSASVTEPSGNTSSLPANCTVSVGNPPIVSWLAPTGSSKLGASSDLNPGMPGWQGELRVQTDVGAVTPAPTVQFSTAAGPLGSAVAVDGAGVATASVSIPEGASVALTATTSDVATRGIGRASITVPVDLSVPTAIATVTATVPEDKRRQTTFHLAWTAPADGAAPVASYDVRISSAPITSQVLFDAAERVPYVGVPAQPGQQDGVDVPDRYIERDYYFAVAAVDAAGNYSALASAGPTRATFRVIRLTGAGDDANNEQFGRTVDGSESINGDAFADLVVGSRNGSVVNIYFGSATGYAATPSVVISGAAGGTRFGYTATIIGDIDGDGLSELAVGAIADGGTGKVSIFKGRTTWAPSILASSAEYVVVGESTAFAGASVGSAIARLGDFDGDGAPDFGIGAQAYSANRGYVAVIRGVAAGTTFPASITLGVANARVIGSAAPAGSAGLFGWTIASFGKFYGGSGSTFATSGYFESSIVGKCYAFANGQVNGEAPADTTTRVADPADAVGYSIAPLGAVGSSPMAVAVGAPRYIDLFGHAEIHLGTTATGPFVASPIVLTNPAADTQQDSFGSCVFGSVVPGIAASVADSRSSFIGTTQPDFAVSGFGEHGGPAKLYIIDGAKLGGLTSSNIAAVADVSVTFPASWTAYRGCSPQSRAIRDMNNDGYADIAIGQFLRLGQYAGEVLVLW